MQDKLTELAITYGTDKFGYHDYMPNYYKLFGHLSDAPIRILEIGVGGYQDEKRGGESLQVWRDFFGKGEVTGLDIQKKTMELGPRVKIVRGSQVDPEFLEEVLDERGPFDIIIDDGSHMNEHIVETYRLLFPKLKPGGIYVAEDVQTSFIPSYGGSLELTAPNSVGYFGEIMGRLNAVGDDPLVRDVAAMERFHNMIALHKAPAKGKASGIWESNRFRDFDGRAVAVTVIGDKSFDLSRLPVTKGEVRHAEWGKGSEAAKSADLVVGCLAEGAGPKDPAALAELIGAMAQSGLFILVSERPERDLAQNHWIMGYARHRFTMVDHVEIKVHFPKAEIDELAAQIYSLERYPNALMFHKSPNTYPSNFAYDATNPQARAALDRMGEVLKDSEIEGGLTQYAYMLTRHVSREAAKDPIAKLTKMGTQTRRFYQLAGALALKEKRFLDAEALFTSALDLFPKDPQFSVSLSSVARGLRDPVRAETILRDCLASHPQAKAVLSHLSQACFVNGKLEDAVAFGRQSIKLFPEDARPDRLRLFAKSLEQAGLHEEAEAALREAEVH